MADDRYWETWLARQRVALEAMPGGAQLMAHLGFTPSFHDAEIVRLDLQRGKPSLLSLQTWKVDQSDRIVVDIAMGTVIDLMLDGFSAQNVVGEVRLELPAPPREDRVNMYFPSGRLAEEVEIGLGDIYGISGFIRCLDVSLSFRPLRRRRR